MCTCIYSIVSANSLRGLSAQDDPAILQHQQGVWYGPEALLPYEVLPDLLGMKDKRASVEYEVEADSRIAPGSTFPACQVDIYIDICVRVRVCKCGIYVYKVDLTGSTIVSVNNNILLLSNTHIHHLLP